MIVNLDDYISFVHNASGKCDACTHLLHCSINNNLLAGDILPDTDNWCCTCRHNILLTDTLYCRHNDLLTVDAITDTDNWCCTCRHNDLLTRDVLANTDNWCFHNDLLTEGAIANNCCHTNYFGYTFWNYVFLYITSDSPFSLITVTGVSSTTSEMVT